MRTPRSETLPLVLEPDGSTLGAVVRRVRQGRSMTLDDLAVLTGLTKSSLSVIENDECDPQVSTMVRLAAGLRLPLYSLLGHSCGRRVGSDEQ